MNILKHLYESKEVYELMTNIPLSHRDDLKQYLFEELLKIDESKLTKMYNKGELINYFKRMLWIQWRINKKRGIGFWKGEVYKVNIEEYQIPEIQNDDDTWNNMLNYFTSEEENKYQNKNLEQILEKFYYYNTNSINYFFNRKVFELYYLEGMTLKQISKNTYISYETIRKSIKFTLDFVKEEIKKINFEL